MAAGKEALERTLPALRAAAESDAVERQLRALEALLGESEAALGELGVKDTDGLLGDARRALARETEAARELRGALCKLCAVLDGLRRAAPGIERECDWECDGEAGHYSAAARSYLLASKSKQAEDNKRKALEAHLAAQAQEKG